MIGRDGKVVIVKQGESLRQITRDHITRLRGKKEEEVDDEEEEATEDVEDEEEELEMVWKSHGEEGCWRGSIGGRLERDTR